LERLGEFLLLIPEPRASKVKLSFIVPAYNEEFNIRSAVDDLLGGLSLLPSKYEIEIVLFDDCSSDTTKKIMFQIKDDNPDKKIVILENEKNSGVGACFVRGVCASQSDLVSLIPGDGIIPSTAIYALCNCVERDQLRLSNRISRYTNNRLRRQASKLFALWFSGITKQKIVDPHSIFLIPTTLAKTICLKLWGQQYRASNFKLDNSYHLILFNELFQKYQKFETVEIAINKNSEQDTRVWNQRFLVRFIVLCTKISIKSCVSRKTFSLLRHKKPIDMAEESIKIEIDTIKTPI
jgi:glycosyltransferase involved in cell wall biosynthesis